MKVLVTGASSLIGTGVVRALMDRGDEVTAFQRHASGLGCVEALGDITDAATITAAAQGMDGVIHLAARVSVVGTWPDFEATNVHGTANALAAARAGGAKRFVHISSPSVAHGGAALVGAGAGPADPFRARGHYSRSKAMAEQAALAAAGQGMAVVALRPHLVWGPGDTQLIGRIVQRAHQGRLALVGSGAALIDTTYLDNAVAAIVAGLDRAEQLDGRTFVVSNGQPRTVRELFTRICQAAGVAPPKLRVPVGVATSGGAVAERVWARLGRSDDPPMTAFLAEQLATAHWFDQRETRAALRWAPAVGLDDGFDRLAAWYAAH
jgi:nucleoside-diphosphate-sugar epimerase